HLRLRCVRESAEPVDYSMELRRLRRADDPAVHGVQRDLVRVEVLEEESADGDDQHDGPVDADADEHADEHDVEETEQEHRHPHAPDEPTVSLHAYYCHDIS